MAAFVPYAGGSAATIVVPLSISVTTAPTKVNYTAGEALNVNGMVVVANMSDGSTQDVTSAVTVTPSAGTALYESNTAIQISWTDPEFGNTFTTTQAISVTRVLSSIAVTSAPTKTEYNDGEALDMTGIAVTATYTSGATATVTGSVTFSPANGSTLSGVGTKNITVSYTENGVTKTATTSVTVKVKIVTFASGTDAELSAMLDAAYDGSITLSDYWKVGDERQVTLSAMAATGVGESHVSQTVTFVILNVGGKTLANGQTCKFIVGLKNFLSNGATGEWGYMNSTNTNSGGWKNSARRTWCNNTFYNSLPSGFKALFKDFVNKSGTGGGSSSGTEDTTDKFALAAEVEVFGTTTYSVAGEGSQFDYYKTAANRVKKAGNSGSANTWWERSPYSGNTTIFCFVNHAGNATNAYAASSYGIAPFGCL